jgi:membrane-associated phospholipid phosphatase
VFGTLTLLGNQEFYLLLIPFLFWCLDRRLGIRIALLYLLGAVLNVGLKDVFDAPRPLALEPTLLTPEEAESIEAYGYGMPSGHAQYTMTIWLALAFAVKRSWFWVVAVLLSLAIGFSRILLGAHFPDQVLAGWLLGAAIFGLYMVVHLPLEATLAKLTIPAQLALALAVPLIFVFLHPVADIIAASAVLLGVGLGLVAAPWVGTWTPEGPWSQRLIRYLIGIVVLLALYFGLSLVFPGEGETLYVPLRFLRYALLGVWITFGAPWLFSRLHLAPTRPAATA